MRVRWTRATPRASSAVAVVWMAAAAAVAATVAVASPTAAVPTAALPTDAMPVAAIPTAAAAAGKGPPLVAAVGRQAFDADAQAAMLDQLRSHGDALDASFLALCGILVFLMQTGFAMLTAGSVRTKNVQSLLFKNLIDCCSGALAFYLFGYALAFGESGNSILGYSEFALSNQDVATSGSFFFQWAVSAAASTIVSGAIAERATVYAYLLYSFGITGFLYPVLAHAVWDSKGWLSTKNVSPLLGSGMIDLAGSSIVHVVGGLCGLWGAVIVGPRARRFVNGVETSFPAHNVALVVLGCFLLWTGWFGFNAGATLSVSTPVAHELFGGTIAVLSSGESVLVSPTLTVKQILVSTTLGGAGGALSGLVLSKTLTKVFNVCFIVNCLLGGLVSITAGCATFEPYASLLVGATGALVYAGISRMLTYLHIDDPVDGTGVHLGCGIWGTLSVGFFSTERLQAIAGFNYTHYGLAYGGGGKLLVCQLIGIAVICGVVTVTITPLFLLLRVFGILRVSTEQEEAGMDGFCHGGAAYPEDLRPWDTITVGESEPPPATPSTLAAAHGLGSFDAGTIDAVVRAAKPPGPAAAAGTATQSPRFAATPSQRTQLAGGGKSTSFPDGRLPSVDAVERGRPGFHVSRSDDTSQREGGASPPRRRSLTELPRRSSEGARSMVSVLKPDTELTW